MVAANIPRDRLERLGPAERTVQTLTTFVDHMVHNRPGILTPAPQVNIGVQWEPVTWKQEGEEKVVYKLTKVGNKSTRTKIGCLQANNQIKDGARVLGTYKKPGLFSEVVTWMYRQVASVWQADNDFAAHWASWSFPKEHRDLKVVLAAFMLCQTRAGDPVRGKDGKVEFYDDDFRAIGEAMFLLRGKHDFNPKLLLRVGDVLNVPGVAAINRELGFGKSARSAFLGRYPKAVEKWLRNREDNPRMLEGLVKAGFRTSVMELASRIGYKPSTPKFFQILRWKQKQSEDGRRALAIGEAVSAAESWEGLTETQICNRIMKDKPSWKRVVGMLPSNISITRAIMMAGIEAGSVSDADLLILAPTLEDLGMLVLEDIKQRIQKVEAENQRAANILTRLKRADSVQLLQEVADKATAKAMEEVTRGLRVYVVVDKSGSMQGALASAKGYLTKFLGGFPLDRTHVSVFNSYGSEITIKSATAAGVENAFKGHNADGATTHCTGVEVLLKKYKPTPDEDTLVIFVGDEGEYNNSRMVDTFAQFGVKPVAFGLLKVPGQAGDYVQYTARQMEIPCFMIEEGLFNDPYAVTRTLRNLISTTPVGKRVGVAPAAPRFSLVEEILNTPLLTKPSWA